MRPIAHPMAVGKPCAFRHRNDVGHARSRGLRRLSIMRNAATVTRCRKPSGVGRGEKNACRRADHACFCWLADGPSLAATPAVAQALPEPSDHAGRALPAGGGNDIMARIVAEKMSPALGQQVVVENRARRRRHDRHPRGREGRARRLHAGARRHRHAGDQPELYPQCRLRPAQGLRAGRLDRHQRAGAPGRASQFPAHSSRT